MGAPRGGTEIEEERKQCGPNAPPGSARTQAKRTTERTHRRGQPAHVAGIEATRAGSKIAKPVAKGNRRDRGEKRREVRARSHLSTTSQEREGEVPPEPPLDAQQTTTHHRDSKRPSSPAKNARAPVDERRGAVPTGRRTQSRMPPSTSARPRARWPVMACRLISDQWRCRRLGWDESQAPRSGIDERTHTQSQRHPPAEAKRPFGVCAKDSVAKLFVFPAGFLLLH